MHVHNLLIHLNPHKAYCIMQYSNCRTYTLNLLESNGLDHRLARWMSLWSAATRRRMVRKAATSRRTPHLVG